MATDLKGLLGRLTPVTKERAAAIIKADMERNAHKYPPPAPDSIALEDPSLDDLDDE